MLRFPTSHAPGLGARRRTDEPTETPIDDAFDTGMDYYMDTDPLIRKLNELVADGVWANAWRVRWGDKLTMRYFQRQAVRTVFQRTMTEVRGRLRGKHYVGVWYYTDRARWMRDFEAALLSTNGASVASSIMLPFGPVRPGMGRFARLAPRGDQTLDRQIVFYPASDDIARNYAFGVFDDGATFWPVALMSAAQGSSTAVQREVRDVDTMANIIRGLGSNAWASGGDAVLRPVTAFTALYEMSELIKEAQDYTMNAAVATAFPMRYATANAIPQDDLAEITDDNLAVASSLPAARQRRHDTTGKFTLERAQEITRAITSALSRATGGQAVADPVSGASLAQMARETETRYAELAKRYGRVNPGTLVKPIPDFVTVSPAPDAHVDIDMAELRLAYEIAVCREMDVPHSFYRTEVSTGTTSGAPNLSFSEKIMADTIRKEQALYARLFDWIYMIVFGELDRDLARTVVGEVTRMRDNDAARPAALAAVAYMTNMLSNDDGHAKLEFELLTVRSAESLAVLIEMQQLGIVPRQLVYRNAQNLFGHVLGDGADKYTFHPDPRLATNLNAPLLPPVQPDTAAKIAATGGTKRAGGKSDSGRPAKKQRTKE